MKNNEKHKFKQSSDTHSQIQPRIAQRREIVLSRSWCNHGYLFPVWPLTIISYYFMLFHIISISALLFKCSWFFNMFSYVCYRIKIYQNNKARQLLFWCVRANQDATWILRIFMYLCAWFIEASWIVVWLDLHRFPLFALLTSTPWSALQAFNLSQPPTTVSH